MVKPKLRRDRTFVPRNVRRNTRRGLPDWYSGTDEATNTGDTEVSRKLFRCTRRDLYRGCPGESNPSDRQGHYIEAEVARFALLEMRKRYPFERFTIQLWPGGSVLIDER